MNTPLTVRASGRVNLIGDHTDYTGGWVLPMILDLGTTVEGQRVSESMWTLTSADEPDAISIEPGLSHPETIEPRWGRYVAGVLNELQALGVSVPGFSGHISTTLPIGSGLSSSAALEVVIARVALAIAGVELEPIAIALLCQRAEHVASGVPCGIMDQLCITVGLPTTATLIDCQSLAFQHVEIPDELEVITRFISHRTLSGSEYSDRVNDCQRIEKIIGPLRHATIADLENIDDERLQRRARHVISENQRVLEFVEALGHKNFSRAGELMLASHLSLAKDYETSNLVMDAAVSDFMSEPGMLGARMTGGGFGGCIVGLKRKT